MTDLMGTLCLRGKEDVWSAIRWSSVLEDMPNDSADDDRPANDSQKTRCDAKGKPDPERRERRFQSADERRLDGGQMSCTDHEQQDGKGRVDDAERGQHRQVGSGAATEPECG